MAKDPNAPPPRPLSVDTVADLCYGAGATTQQALEDALAVCLAESGLDASNSLINTAALGARGPSIGSIDRGLFQINSYWHREVTDPVAYDPAGNVREAYRISGGFRSFGQWSTWPTHANRQRETARAAAARRIAKGGTGATAGSGYGSADSLERVATSPAATPGQPLIPSLGSSADTPWTITPLPTGYVYPLVVDAITLVGRTTLTDKFRLGPYVLGGTVDLTADEVSEITLELYNGNRELLGDGRGTLSSTLRWGGVFDYRVSADQLNPTDYGATVSITARPRSVQHLRRVSAVAGETNTPSLNDLSATEYVERVAKGVDLRTLGQGCARRPTIAPAEKGDRLETAWEVFLRLAEEEGFICFEADGVLHFGQPSWLLARGTEVRVGWSAAWGSAELDAVGEPDFRRTEDSWREATITVALPRHRGELVRPGMRLLTKGVYGLGVNDWLITRVSWPVDDGIAPVSVDAVIPVNPAPTLERETSTGLPSQAAEAEARGATASTVAGTLNALDFVTYALEQAGDAYVFGAEAAVNDADPDVFDCSELVQWAAGRAGAVITDGTWLQYRAIRAAELYMDPADAIGLRGALLYRFSSNPLVGGRPSSAHVAISLGDGRTIEAANRDKGVLIGNANGRNWTHAGMVPGLDYGPARAGGA